MDGGLSGIDILAVASYLIGCQNLRENRQQTAQNDVSAANDRQAEYLLRELHRLFDEQNMMLKEILKELRKWSIKS